MGSQRKNSPRKPVTVRVDLAAAAHPVEGDRDRERRQHETGRAQREGVGPLAQEGVREGGSAGPRRARSRAWSGRSRERRSCSAASPTPSGARGPGRRGWSPRRERRARPLGPACVGCSPGTMTSRLLCPRPRARRGQTHHSRASRASREAGGGPRARSWGLSRSTRQSSPAGTWTTRSGAAARTVRAPPSRGAARRAGQHERAKPAGCPRRARVARDGDRGAPLHRGDDRVDRGVGDEGVVHGVHEDRLGRERLGSVEPRPDRRQHALAPALVDGEDRPRRDPGRGPHPLGRSTEHRDDPREARPLEQTADLAEEGALPEGKQGLRPSHPPALSGRQDDRHDAHGRHWSTDGPHGSRGSLTPCETPPYDPGRRKEPTCPRGSS